jgi:hypothetical protein
MSPVDENETGRGREEASDPRGTEGMRNVSNKIDLLRLASFQATLREGGRISSELWRSILALQNTRRGNSNDKK